MKERLTYSRIQMRKNCPAKEYYRYSMNLVPKRQTSARGMGSAVHKGIETRSFDEAIALYDTIFPASQDEADKLETERAVVAAMLGGYFELYPAFPESLNEIEFDIPIINPKTKHESRTFTLAGKIDAVATIDDQVWLVEYKTAGAVNKSYIDKLYLDTQMTTYIYAIQRALNIRITGVIYRIIRKPSIKQTQKETLPQYCDRVAADYKARPEFYFFEEKLYRSQDDLQEFEAELWAFTQEYLRNCRDKIHYKNTSRCLDWGTCEYMNICLKEPDWQVMYTVKEPNEELEGTDDATSA